MEKYLQDVKRELGKLHVTTHDIGKILAYYRSSIERYYAQGISAGLAAERLDDLWFGF